MVIWFTEIVIKGVLAYEDVNQSWWKIVRSCLAQILPLPLPQDTSAVTELLWPPPDYVSTQTIPAEIMRCH